MLKTNDKIAQLLHVSYVQNVDDKKPLICPLICSENLNNLAPDTRFLSGVQATGSLHIGNYFGAIAQFAKLSNKFNESIFFIADLHSLTSHHKNINIRENVLHTLAAYIASGIDVDKSILFAQSKVSQHAELMWILSCITPIGMLGRMTQFKAKQEQAGEMLGLLSYPVLMAADILLYNASHIPVGEDQIQHIELTRSIANKFNNAVASEIFCVPQAIMVRAGSKIMSLIDGTSKMSKSHESDYSRINLLDSNDVIVKKIRKAKTDNEPLHHDIQKMAQNGRHEAVNLLRIFSVATGLDLQEICMQYDGVMFKDFKNDLADAVIASISGVRDKMFNLLNNKDYLEIILQKGAEKAGIIAKENLSKIFALLRMS
jgi:tryptophanyl-tRNA synthetase